jgi:1,4-alpha-glucan branching enzyme
MSVVSLLRKGKDGENPVLIACNFTPVPRVGYMVGVPAGGYWKELLNSDGRNMAAAAWATWGARRLWLKKHTDGLIRCD